MDILNYSNNVIHILLEFFFDTIIEFFFWLDYHIISFGVIIASKNTKLFAKNFSEWICLRTNFVICVEIPRSPHVFYDRRELFCPRILSFRSGSRWVRAHFLGKPSRLTKEKENSHQLGFAKSKAHKRRHKESILIYFTLNFLPDTNIREIYAITYYLIRAPETVNVPLAVSMTSLPFWKNLRALLALVTTGA